MAHVLHIYQIYLILQIKDQTAYPIQYDLNLYTHDKLAEKSNLTYDV